MKRLLVIAIILALLAGIGLSIWNQARWESPEGHQEIHCEELGNISPEVNSYQDTFASLDSARWGISISNAGTVTTTGGKLTIITITRTDAAIAYLKTKISQTSRQLYRVMYATPSLLSETNDTCYLLNVQDSAGSTPVVKAYATTDVRVQVYVRRTVDPYYVLQIVYRNIDNNLYYWDAANNTWSLVNTTYCQVLTAPDEYYVNFETMNGSFRIMVVNSSYTRWVAITDWVTWAVVDTPSSNLYLCMGQPYINNNRYKGKLEVETFDYYNGRTCMAYFNGKGLDTAYDYGIFRCNIYRETFGFVTIPWRIPVITAATINNGIDVSEVKTHIVWPSAVNWNDKDYIFANAYGTKYDLFYFTTTDDGDTISMPQSNPIIIPHGTEWIQTNVCSTTVIRDEKEVDPTKRWKFYVTGTNAAAIATEGYFYAADPPTDGSNWILTEYGGNPVIDVIPGGWNELGLGVTQYLEVSGERRLYATGMSTDYMGHTAYYENPSGDWVTWILDAASVLQWSSTTTTEDITVNVAGGDSYVHVAVGHEGHAGAVGDVVFIYDTDNAAARIYRVDANRIKSISTLGQIDLETPINRSFNLTKQARIRNANYANLNKWNGGHAIQVVDFSRYQYGYGVWYGIFRDYAKPPLTEFIIFYRGTTDFDWTWDYAVGIVIPWAPWSEGSADTWMTCSAENLRYTQLASSTMETAYAKQR